VGIDAARPEEFQGSYPFARAFRPGEFSLALGICRSGQEHAAALLWSLKEAAVKALGCGFHTLDPLALEARSPTAWDGGHLWRVRSEESLAVWVTRRKEAWLAVAHLEPCGQALES
jgi:phosphopantetheinyl transferase